MFTVLCLTFMPLSELVSYAITRKQEADDNDMFGDRGQPCAGFRFSQ